MTNVSKRFRKGALSKAANAVRSAGRYGDTHVVHINDRELAEMAGAWGMPTINPDTGLPEFFDLGGILSSAAQIASAVAPVVMQATAKKPVVQSSGPTYTQPTGARGPVGPTGNPTHTTSSDGGFSLSGVLGSLGNSNVLWPALIGAGITAIDQLYDPKTPSVADQLAEIQAAQNRANPEWNKPLPKAEFNRSANDMSGIDWSNYGTTGGQADFFGGQDNPTIKAAHGGAIAQMRDAGRMYRGPGGGQDDKIPAMLSNNEYVIDATTVADLGDGDPEAGAAKLDQFRAAVGRQKGRKPGTVPPKAHSRIMDYMHKQSGAMPTRLERMKEQISRSSGAMPTEMERSRLLKLMGGQ